MLQNLLLEKMLKEYDYLSSDVKYKKAIIEHFLPILKTIEEPVTTTQLQPPSSNVDKIKHMPSEIEKQIYRQISKLTHPDKNENNTLQFKNAVDAYSSGNFLQLMKIAHDLQIQFQIDEETVEKIDQEIIELKMQSKMLDQHLIMKWYFSKNEIEKESLEQMIKAL